MADPPPGSTATPALADRLRSRIDERVAGYVGKRQNLGLAVGVVCGGENLLIGYGRQSKERDTAPDPSSLFEIGSITKVFTANVLASLVERDEVALDDPVQKYLPPQVTMPTRNGSQITLRHLATHTSGLPRLPTNLMETVKDEGNPYALYTVDDLYRFLSGYRLRRDIGARYEYSNLGAGLLGHALGLAAGRSYEELVVERVCNLLDLNDTRITLTDDQTSRLVPGHSEEGEVVPHWDTPTLPGAGALRSSSRDMHAYLLANLDKTAPAPVQRVFGSCQRAQVSRARKRGLVLRYAVAVLLAALGAGIPLWRGQEPWGTSSGFASFGVPVWLSGRFGGLGPGVATALLYTAAARYFWMAPRRSFVLASAETTNRVFLLLLAGAFLAWLGGRGHRAKQREEIGLAWHLDPLGPETMHWHNGGTGGFCSFLGFVKARNVGVVLLSNSANSVDDLGIDILRLLVREAQHPSEPSQSG